MEETENNTRILLFVLFFSLILCLVHSLPFSPSLAAALEWPVFKRYDRYSSAASNNIRLTRAYAEMHAYFFRQFRQ